MKSDEIKQAIDRTRAKIEHHERKIQDLETRRGERLAGLLSTSRLKPGEDPYQWPVLAEFGKSIGGHEACLEDLKLDLMALKEMFKEAQNG